jgi:chromosome segregation ATPase
MKTDDADQSSNLSRPQPNFYKTEEVKPQPIQRDKSDTLEFTPKFDAVHTARQLFDWVVEKKDYIDKIEKQRTVLDESNSELKREISVISVDNKKLKEKIETINKELDKWRSENDSIKKKYERHVKETEKKIKAFAEESERREQRMVQEAKNRLKRDLTIFVQELIDLNEQKDIPDKAGRQNKIFKNIIKALDMHGIRFEK